jgi:hypothetical protein
MNAGGLDEDYANAVAVDVEGNAFYTGSFLSQSCTFGKGRLNVLNTTAAGTSDVFLTKVGLLLSTSQAPSRAAF